MKSLLLAAACLLSFSVYSQTTINFDNYVSSTDNDLTNSFTQLDSLTQITSGGIGGGCVQTVYLYHPGCFYKDTFIIGVLTTSASVCFKYNSATYALNDNYLGVGMNFFCVNNSLGNKYLSVTASGQYMNITSSTATMTDTLPGSATLTNGHWYKLSYDFTVYSTDSTHMTANAYLYDIGTNGSAIPTTVLSKTNLIFNNEFSPDHRVRFLVNGAKRGGGQYFDNVYISGVATTGIVNIPSNSYFDMPTLVNYSIPVRTDFEKEVTYRIVSIDGRLLKTGTFTHNADIDIKQLPMAVYIIQFTGEGLNILKKFVKE